MSPKKSPTDLNRAGLVHEVATRLGMKPRRVDDVLTTAFEAIAAFVAEGRNITISNFGTFRAVDEPERVGHNPQTGGRVRIAARRVARFKVSPVLAQVVSGRRDSIRKRPKGGPR